MSTDRTGRRRKIRAAEKERIVRSMSRTVKGVFGMRRCSAAFFHAVRGRLRRQRCMGWGVRDAGCCVCNRSSARRTVSSTAASGVSFRTVVRIPSAAMYGLGVRDAGCCVYNRSSAMRTVSSTAASGVSFGTAVRIPSAAMYGLGSSGCRRLHLQPFERDADGVFDRSVGRLFRDGGSDSVGSDVWVGEFGMPEAASTTV